MEQRGYRTVKVLGRGSYGEAVLVEDPKKHRAVIKAIGLQDLDEAELARTETEVAILQQLAHPNIVKYHDHFTHEDKLYIVMEYADSGSLQSFLDGYHQRGSTVAEPKVLDYFGQLCLAVQHLHGLKIVHRDLTAQNVFLADGKRTLKLGDFGIATILHCTNALMSTHCGTPHYMSPELVMGRLYSSRSDIWALGCLLYQLLACRHPFQCKSLPETVARICSGEYAPPPSKYSRPLLNLLGMLLSVDPQKRPTIGQVLHQPFMVAARDQTATSARPVPAGGLEVYVPKGTRFGGGEAETKAVTFAEKPHVFNEEDPAPPPSTFLTGLLGPLPPAPAPGRPSAPGPARVADMATAELERRRQELDAREEALQLREQQLRQREAEMSTVQPQSPSPGGPGRPASPPGAAPPAAPPAGAESPNRRRHIQPRGRPPSTGDFGARNQGELPAPFGGDQPAGVMRPKWRRPISDVSMQRLDDQIQSAMRGWKVPLTEESVQLLEKQILRPDGTLASAATVWAASAQLQSLLGASERDSPATLAALSPPAPPPPAEPPAAAAPPAPQPPKAKAAATPQPKPQPQPLSRPPPKPPPPGPPPPPPAAESRRAKPAAAPPVLPTTAAAVADLPGPPLAPVRSGPASAKPTAKPMAPRPTAATAPPDPPAPSLPTQAPPAPEGGGALPTLPKAPSKPASSVQSKESRHAQDKPTVSAGKPAADRLAKAAASVAGPPGVPEGPPAVGQPKKPNAHSRVVAGAERSPNLGANPAALVGPQPGPAAGPASVKAPAPAVNAKLGELRERHAMLCDRLAQWPAAGVPTPAPGQPAPAPAVARADPPAVAVGPPKGNAHGPPDGAGAAGSPTPGAGKPPGKRSRVEDLQARYGLAPGREAKPSGRPNPLPGRRRSDGSSQATRNNDDPAARPTRPEAGPPAKQPKQKLPQFSLAGAPPLPPDVGVGPAHHQAESLRMHLEAKLSPGTFMAVYNLLADASGGGAPVLALERCRRLVSPPLLPYLGLVQQLVAFDHPPLRAAQPTVLQRLAANRQPASLRV